MKKATLIKTGAMALLIAYLGITALESCNKKNKPETITPAKFPTQTGLQFPVDSNTIYGWLNNYDTASITKHAWDIWAGLTAITPQVYKTDTLRVFETWLGVKEIAALCAAGTTGGGCNQPKTSRAPLSIPRQFVHAQILAGNAKIDTGFNIYETVVYNPSAACFATENLIFNKSVLDKYAVKDGIGAIKPFPSDAITTKPTYYAGKPDASGLIRVPTWTGPPAKAQVYPPTSWNLFVYVDINNKQQPGYIPQPVGPNATPEQIKAATCNASDFIYYTLDAAAAAYLNLHQDKGNAQFEAGDIALLVAMHVATKEISNWTWQTFFWTPNPAKPLFPSSVFAANLRPPYLYGAANHYAVVTTYNMVWPNQPITGGTNTNVTPLIGYNPYLEAGLQAPFGNKNLLDTAYQYGVQTNCMTCHAYATESGNTPYSADQYVDMKDPIFINQVQLDFAWSILLNLNKNK